MGSKGRAAMVPLWLLCLPVAAMLVLLVALAQRPDGRLHLWALDVGQGQALLLSTPKGHRALVDGGRDPSDLHGALGRHSPFWDNSLHLVALTQPHGDRLGGLVEILARRRVEQVVQGRFAATGALREAWREALARSGARVKEAQRGDRITFDGEEGVAITVLYPAAAQEGDGPPLALKVEYGAASILIFGESDRAGVAHFLSVVGEEEAKSDALVLALDRDFSGVERLIEAVEPQVVIISTKGNAAEGQGGVVPEAQLSLQQAAGSVYSTYAHGEVELILAEGEMWVSVERQP